MLLYINLPIRNHFKQEFDFNQRCPTIMMAIKLSLSSKAEKAIYKNNLFISIKYYIRIKKRRKKW
jgi:hypothetical protein